MEIFEGKLVEVGEVFKGGDVFIEEGAVALKEGGLAVVNARRVQPDSFDRTVLGEPERGIGVEAGEV